MDHLEKYEIINDFFGISAIHINNVTKTVRERKTKIRKLEENFNIINWDNFDKLTEVITSLKKPIEKRADKDLELITPLLEEIDFFKKRQQLTKLEFEEVAKNIKYELKQPGDVIYSIMDKADKFFIVLKGKAMV